VAECQDRTLINRQYKRSAQVIRILASRNKHSRFRRDRQSDSRSAQEVERSSLKGISTVNTTGGIYLRQPAPSDINSHL